ncbi:MAG: histidine--tRNA ligase [Chlamydia sp.]
MPTAAPTGVFDILPNPPTASALWTASAIWQHVEKVAKSVANDYGFHEIRTPLFEKAELFQRNVGEVTDIVSKEMYIFEDRGGRKLALRPEGTASVMRALIEHQSFSSLYDMRLFYIGPMFRYERPQAGRFRQHHQFGMEVVGISSYEQDAEIIDALCTFYKRLTIPNLTVSVNSLGSKEARTQFRKSLIEYLQPLYHSLSEESRLRLEKNPLRILDSKDLGDQEIIAKAPSIIDFLSPEDRVHFEGVLKTLSNLHIEYRIDPKLVRGLDYYQRTVFEVTTTALGAQNTIGGGGRYDGLLHHMGGPDLPSIGFGTGLERVIQTMIQVGSNQFSSKNRVECLIVPMGEKAKEYAMKLAQELRELHIRTVVDISGKKLKWALSSASQADIQSVLVLGENELVTGIARLKWLQEHREEEVLLNAKKLSSSFITRAEHNI